MSQAQRQRPRQDPVSCESCRKKKLKCNRQQPCTNCATRQILCEFKQSAAVVSPPGEHEDLAFLRAENIAIKTRLERLEAIIYDKGASLACDSRPTKARRLDNEGQKTNNMPSPLTTVSDSAAAEVAKKYRGDFRWLEGVGARENTRLQRLSLPFVTRISPLQSIVDTALAEVEDERCILLPPFEQTMAFVDTYMTQIDPVQHVAHGPTVRRAVRALFERLERGDSVEPEHTVLLLSMLASVASFCGLEGFEPSFFSHQDTALRVGQLWLRRALDVLEYVRRSASATMETLQSNIITLFIVFHIEGFSPKARAMQFAAVAVAKDLGLHRTDDPSAPTVSLPVDEVDKEMRRRLMWHLACTDWSVAALGGPSEGTYNVDPKHMRVKLPRNVSDEELETMPADFQHPPSVPTTAAYHLQRIRLGEICREIADLRWSYEVDDVAADDIKALDAKFEALFDDLPAFLQVRPDVCTTDMENRHPIIRMQRYTVNLMINARRCKFHLQFLLRASFDSRYSFSREICLRTARSVIQIREELLNQPRSMWIASARLCGMVHIFFYATVVLVMDLCINKDPDSDTARREEIQAACRILEDAKRQSPAAGMFMDSLRVIFRKHKIKLQGQEQHCEASSGEVPPARGVSEEYAPGTGFAFPPAAAVECPGAPGDEDIPLGDLWQSYITMEPEFDPQSWDALINDIETMQRDDGSLGLDLTAL